jgi:hypothetical protein
MRQAIVGFLVRFCRVFCRVILTTRQGSILHNQQLRLQMSGMSGFYRSREHRRIRILHILYIFGGLGRSRLTQPIENIGLE